MIPYTAIKPGSINRLINHGPLVLVATTSSEGVGNIAPIAWNCPVQKDPPTLLIVLGKRHKTTENIKATNEFVVVVPHSSQLELVGAAGAASGHTVNKPQSIGYATRSGKDIQAPIPDGCVAWLECRCREMVTLDHVEVVIGNVVQAFAQAAAFSERLDVEQAPAKTLHHLGGKDFMIPGPVLHL